MQGTGDKNMENYKTKVLELIENAKRGTLDRNDLMKKLNITGASETAEFDKVLDEMEEEMMIIRAKGNCYMNREQYGLEIGVIKINRKGIGYVDRPGKPSVMVISARMKDALDGDLVAVHVEPRYSSRFFSSASGTVVKVLKRAKSTLIGTYINTPNGPKLWPDDEKFRGYSVSMKEPEGFTPLPGMKVLAEINSFNNPLELTFVKMIGFKDDPGMDLLSILYDHDIDPEFPAEVMKEAEAIPQEVSEEEKEGRTDLTGDITVTIDGDDSKDFDDAVSVRKNGDGWVLKVSIADVSHYVTENSPLDQEAFKRGTSNYIIDKVVPMLPQLLSNGICSLNPHVIRLTNTCEMDVDANGYVTDARIYPSFMRSTERMTYKNVNRIYDGDEELRKQYAHIVEMLEDLRDCADAIRKKRVAEGAIDFESDEPKIIVDETGRPLDIQARESGHGEKIIEDCMIAANVAVASLMNRSDFPCVYRIHDEPNVKKLTQYAHMAYMLGHPFNVKNAVSPKEIQRYLSANEDTPEYQVLSSQMLRCMAKAVYSDKCLGHFGLAEQEYLHFTSPIRRYPDLIVHRMLRRYYFENDFTHRNGDEEKMRLYAEHSSEREWAADDAEYECEDMKKAEYMAERIGQVFTGTITSVKNFGFYVTLPNTIEGLVRVESLYDGYYRYDEARMSLINERAHIAYRVGDTITIRVVSASKEARLVEFGVIRQSSGKVKEKVETGTKGRKTRSRSARKAEQFGYERNTRTRGRKKNGKSKKR